jgi:hypothetical protein
MYMYFCAVLHERVCCVQRNLDMIYNTTYSYPLMLLLHGARLT